MFVIKLLPYTNARILHYINKRPLRNGLIPNICYSIRGSHSLDQNDKKGTLAHSQQSQVNTEVRPLGERLKENTKTATYMGVIVLGAGVTALMFYAIFRELFSSKSANGVYSAALEKCIKDYRIEDSLGAPIKAYGEETRRGRRGHVAHTSFIKDGVPHMQMMFHLQGIRNRAQVRLEVKENESGDWEYRYLFAQLEDYPKTTIILEDNRFAKSNAANQYGVI